MVIKDIVEAQGEKVKAFVDDNPVLDVYDGRKVLHSTEEVDVLIVSIGDNAARKRVVERLGDKRFGLAIHPSAVVSPSAIIGDGTVVMAGAVINAGAVIGRHCIINTGASVDHECVLGDYVHVAPHASLCGQVQVGEGTLMGVGSCAIPCVKVGCWSTVGAGSSAVCDIPDGVIAVGMPAKIIKPIYMEDMK